MKRSELPIYEKPPPPPQSAASKHKRELFAAYIAGSEGETIFGLWNTQWGSLHPSEKVRRIRCFLSWYNKKYNPVWRYARVGGSLSFGMKSGNFRLSYSPSDINIPKPRIFIDPDQLSETTKPPVEVVVTHTFNLID